ncbi:MAG: hypothetical protein IJ597_07350 [Synergistaceae bacterium]|nr:hypothetical protein [Synergistaceae bacterium]
MKKQNLIFVSCFFALFLAIFLTACSAEAKVTLSGGFYIVDDAEGYAPVVNGAKKAARDEAKRMAYRDALEKALGACVTGITEMENFAVTRDKVFSKATGIVKDFKVTEEFVDKDGVLNLKGVCKVGEKALDGTLGPDVIAMLGNPRIMILVDEKVGDTRPFISTTEAELMKIFEKAGYLLVDPEQAKVLLHLDPSQAFDDPVKLSEAARTLRADIIIVGRAIAGAFARQKVYGVQLYGVSGTVQLKAVLTQTAYQISSKTVSASTGKKPAQTIGGGADRCFRSAATTAAEEIVYKIAYNMASASSSLGGVTVNIKIAGATFKDVEKIEKALGEFSGKDGDVFERSYKDNLLEIDLVSQNTARKAASFLSEIGVEVDALTAQTINAHVLNNEETNSDSNSESKITISISDVNSFKDAGAIEDALREFLDDSDLEMNYKNKILTFEIKNSPVTSRKLAAFLSDNNIEVDGVEKDSITGKMQLGVRSEE